MAGGDAGSGGAVALLAAAVLLLPGRAWSTLGRMVVGHWLALLLAVAGVAGLAVGGLLWRRARPAAESSAAPVPPQRPLRPLPTWMSPRGGRRQHTGRYRRWSTP
ncbi:hypothetical protein [Micromonospora sp. LOL_021]|uniref:hypothetical protein n=1 Tax=Micromonospora sp. LOL_021 TaxID=3345417 RepID=UPI003A86E057